MAWREFVQVSAPLLRSIVRRTLTPSGRAADTSDVLQKIYILFCAKNFHVLRPFDPHKGRLSSWLSVIAARAAIDHLRAQGAVLTSLETQPEAAHTSAPERAETGPLTLPPDLLSPQQELILRLCYEDDLDVADIAQVLRTQPQTVRSQRHKALERLRAYLSKRTFF